jgi:DNA-binding NtrC family response regulator
MSAAPPSGARVLIVDDDADVLKAASLLLSRAGFGVRGAESPAAARSALAAEAADLVLLDLNFTRGATAGEEGLACLRQLLRDDPDLVVVVVTAHSGVNVAVKAMQAGARDFVIKPWNNQRLLATVEAALPVRAAVADGGEAAVGEEPEPTLLGESPAMEEVRRLVARAGPTDAAVLVTGEAGTGKSLTARRLHLASLRAGGPFVVLDLAALEPQAVEAALFGPSGALAEAAGGTLVLDEVGELPPLLQGRLCAALERAEDGRVVSTSRRPLAALRGRGGVRDDLLYRLNTVEIALPPLTARGEDPLRLAEHFLRRAARRHRRPPLPLSPAAAQAIMAAPWSGGVRALAQAAERAVLFAEGRACEPADLGLEPTGPHPAPPGALDLQASERALVSAALKRHRFNVSHAARELGLTRPALYRRMAKHGL